MSGLLRTAASARHAPFASILLVVTLLLAACGSGAGSPSPTTEAASPAPSASGDVAERPEPTRWPGGVIEAVLILAKTDKEIETAGNDLRAAAASEDLEAMWGAADGLAILLEKLPQQVDRIRDYPVTAAAARAYDAALPDMLAGATKIRDSIRAGDGPGLAAGVQQLAQGTAAYEAVRTELGPLVEPAILMQRLLVK